MFITPKNTVEGITRDASFAKSIDMFELSIQPCQASIEETVQIQKEVKLCRSVSCNSEVHG
jgi:hypothetical protein